MSIQIKQATAEDAAFLAQMMLQSSRAGKKDGLFDLIFKTNDEKILLEKLEKLAQTTAKSHCHYKNFLIAQVDGKSVGTLCSYEPRISTQETFITALQEIGCGDEVKAPLAIVYGCDFETNNRTLMFDFMEELEGFIDVGILKALMKKSLLTARLKGYRIAQTIIEIGSLETELFYKKLGFREVAQRECEAYKEIFGRNGLMLFSIEF
ncbi:acyl-CoA acyltransferase [Sulfurimonas sp.]